MTDCDNYLHQNRQMFGSRQNTVLWQNSVPGQCSETRPCSVLGQYTTLRQYSEPGQYTVPGQRLETEQYTKPGQCPEPGQHTVPGQCPETEQYTKPGQCPEPGQYTEHGQRPETEQYTIPGQCPQTEQYTVPGQCPKIGQYTVPGQCPETEQYTVPGQYFVHGKNTTHGRMLHPSPTSGQPPPPPPPLLIGQGYQYSSNMPPVEGSDQIYSQLYKPSTNTLMSGINASNYTHNSVGGNFSNQSQPYGQIRYVETYTLFSDDSIRAAFVRKVYSVLTIQLLFTTGLIMVFLKVEPLKYWVQRNILFYYLAFGVFIIVYITLICCEDVRRTYPLNYICLIIFTLAMSYMMGVVSCMHRTSSVYMAFAMTAALTICITLFATFTKLDFTKCHAFIFFILIAFTIFGIACVIHYAIYGPNKILSVVYAGVGLVVFSLLLCYDTQLIVGGRSHEYNEEDYITAVLSLYLDIVYIFMQILSLIGLTGQD